LIKKIGEGAFARVILAWAKTSGMLFAMKIIEKSKIIIKNEHCSEEESLKNMYRVKQVISERNIFS